MANKDYDDLLRSFMNNSSKAYDEDRHAVEKQAQQAPVQRNAAADRAARHKKEQQMENRLAAKKRKKASKPPKESTPARKLGKVLLGCLMVICVVGIVCCSVLFIYGYSVVHGDKVFDLTEQKYSQNMTSFIYGTDKNGKTVEITRLHGEENRIWVDMDDMSPYMPKAFVAGEDKRFYEHHGVDWVRTIGVFVKPHQLRSGRFNHYPAVDQELNGRENQVTFIRKFNEILQALNLERNYSKDEIIEAYLNTVYLSNGCYGVKTAAEKYFGKDIKDLNAAECASLAAITKAPSTYDPLNDPKANKKRQEYFLEAMYKEGSISKDEYESAKSYKLVFTNSKEYKGSKVKAKSTKKAQTVNSYYVDHVITSVIEDLQKNGYTYKKAKNMVYGGGLKIYTAIDFDVQKALENVYENYKRMPDETVQGAMVVMDYNGRVLGLVGWHRKEESQFGTEPRHHVQATARFYH